MLKRVTAGAVVAITASLLSVPAADAATITARNVIDKNRDGIGDVRSAPGRKAQIGETSKDRGVSRTMFTVKLPAGAQAAAASGTPVKVSFRVYRAYNVNSNQLAVDAWAGKSTKRSAKADYSRVPTVTVNTPASAGYATVDVTQAAAQATGGTLVIRMRLAETPARDGARNRVIVYATGASKPRIVVGSGSVLTAPPAGDIPAAFEADVVNRINQVRATGYTCTDGKQFGPAGPLANNAIVASAARGHSTWMANTNSFSHTGANGSTPGDRLEAADYDWSAYGENIAAGYPTAERAVEGWLNSPGHCHNLMNPTFTETGVGYVYNANSTYGYYWTQNFATPA